MLRIRCADITVQQQLALVQACRDVGGGPWKGIHYGTGRHVPMPEAVTEADLASDDRALTIGWTFHGPQGLGVIDLPATLCIDIQGARGAALVRDATTLARARLAIGLAQIPEEP